MLIEGVRLFSYGPFEDSRELKFAEGMNLLVGQNNSGKSAVLKSFKNDPVNWPHRSLERFRDIDLERSKQWLRVQVSGAEIRDAFMARGGELHFPIDRQLNDVDPAWIAAEFFSKDRICRFECTRQENTFTRLRTH